MTLRLWGLVLRFLWTTVRKIGRENNNPVEEAITKLLSDVGRQYNNRLRNEVSKLNQEQAALRSDVLGVGPQVSETVCYTRIIKAV
jgi:hypothetical protein